MNSDFIKKMFQAGKRSASDMNIFNPNGFKRLIGQELPRTILTPDEAIMKYKSSEGFKVNDMLRRDRLDEDGRAIVDGVDKKLQELPAYSEPTFRAFHFYDDDLFEKFRKEYGTAGNTVQDKAFMSTTKDYTKFFSPQPGYHAALYRVNGKSGRDISEYGLREEEEVLFPRNTKFVIDRADMGRDGNLYGEMTEL